MSNETLWKNYKKQRKNVDNSTTRTYKKLKIQANKLIKNLLECSSKQTKILFFKNKIFISCQIFLKNFLRF